MPQAYKWVGRIAALGMALMVGCYTERTIDEVTRMPDQKPGKSKAAQTPPKETAASRPKPKSAAPQDPKAKSVADRTKRFADRVRGESATKLAKDAKPAAKPGTPTVVKTAKSTRVTSGKSKQAVHVASDSFETGKTKPVKTAKPGPVPPWRKSIAEKTAKTTEKTTKPTAKPSPTKVELLEPAKPSAKPPEAKKPVAPPAMPTVRIIKPKASEKAKPTIVKVDEKPEVKPPPAKKPAAKPTPKVTPKPTAKPAPEVTKEPAPAAVKTIIETTAKKPAPAKAKPSGFVVPTPPKITSKPAKSRHERLATAKPPSKPKVGVEPKPETKVDTSKAAKPNVPARSAAPAQRDVMALRTKKFDNVKANPNDLVKQMEYRLLCLAAGDTKSAQVEIPGTNAQVQAVIDKLVQVNLTAFKSGGRDTSAAATRLLGSVEDLRKLLKRHADLEIDALKLCSRVDRFGVYQEIKPRRFRSGKQNRAIVYCEVKNFTSVPTEDGQFRVLLAQRIKVLDSDGHTVHQTSENDVPYTCRKRIEDFFIRQLVELPSSLPPGKYILRVYVEDKLAAKARENQLEFTLTRQ